MSAALPVVAPETHTLEKAAAPATPMTEKKAAAILERIRGGGDPLRAVGNVQAGIGGFLPMILELLKGLFGGLLSGICNPSPAEVHEMLTQPTHRQARAQANQLERSVRRARFDPDIAAIVEDAVTEEKLSLTLEEVTALMSENKRRR